MGYKTIKFEEFADRVVAYWLPSDIDLAAEQATVDEIAANWGDRKGFLRLVFDDATQVLTQIDHRLESGAFQELWATGQDPAAVVAAAQRAEAVAGFPTSFGDMWMTWNRWDEFLEYAQSRHIDENTDFLVAVEAYRQAPSVQGQLELYGTYIVDGAPKQINIDADVVTAIEARTDGGADVFDAAQAFVFGLLDANFGGFLTWLAARV